MDRAGAQHRGGGDVVDAVRRRDGLLQGRRDEALHQLGRGAGIDRGHGDDRVGEQRKLPHGQRCERAQTHEQDQRADHECQHRPADENIGETHRGGPGGYGRAAFVRLNERGRVDGRHKSPGLQLGLAGRHHGLAAIKALGDLDLIAEIEARRNRLAPQLEDLLAGVPSGSSTSTLDP